MMCVWFSSSCHGVSHIPINHVSMNEACCVCVYMARLIEGSSQQLSIKGELESEGRKRCGLSFESLGRWRGSSAHDHYIYHSTEYSFLGQYLLPYTPQGLSCGIPHATELIARRVRLMRDIKSHSPLPCWMGETQNTWAANGYPLVMIWCDPSSRRIYSNQPSVIGVVFKPAELLIITSES